MLWSGEKLFLFQSHHRDGQRSGSATGLQTCGACGDSMFYSRDDDDHNFPPRFFFFSLHGKLQLFFPSDLEVAWYWVCFDYRAADTDALMQLHRDVSLVLEVQIRHEEWDPSLLSVISGKRGLSLPDEDLDSNLRVKFDFFFFIAIQRTAC